MARSTRSRAGSGTRRGRPHSCAIPRTGRRRWRPRHRPRSRRSRRGNRRGERMLRRPPPLVGERYLFSHRRRSGKLRPARGRRPGRRPAAPCTAATRPPARSVSAGGDRWNRRFRFSTTLSIKTVNGFRNGVRVPLPETPFRFPTDRPGKFGISLLTEERSIPPEGVTDSSLTSITAVTSQKFVRGAAERANVETVSDESQAVVPIGLEHPDQPSLFARRHEGDDPDVSVALYDRQFSPL